MRFYYALLPAFLIGCADDSTKPTLLEPSCELKMYKEEFYCGKEPVMGRLVVSNRGPQNISVPVSNGMNQTNITITDLDGKVLSAFSAEGDVVLNVLTPGDSIEAEVYWATPHVLNQGTIQTADDMRAVPNAYRLHARPIGYDCMDSSVVVLRPPK